jgi:hypothetical protein
MNRILLPLAALLAVGAGAAPSPTRILDPAAAQKLLHNKGATLQWIDWNTRGSARVTVTNGVWHLRAAQAGGDGRLLVDGTVTEIGRDYFLLDGTVRITDTPDKGRACEKHDVWRFAVTQGRPYWRIRQFEWCDELTDYVDVYF